MLTEEIRDKMNRVSELRDMEIDDEVNGISYRVTQFDSNRWAVFEHTLLFEVTLNGVTDTFEVSADDLIKTYISKEKVTLQNIQSEGDVVKDVIRDFRMKHLNSVIEMNTLHKEIVDYQIKEDMLRKQTFLITSRDGREAREYIIPEHLGFVFEGNSLYRKCLINKKKDEDEEPEVKMKYIGSACVITEIGTDINNGRQYYHLVWRNSAGQFCDKWLPCHLFYSKNGVNEIMTVTQSCIISENAHKDAIDYFKEIITDDDMKPDKEQGELQGLQPVEMQQIERIDIVELNGWTDETYTCLIAGNRAFTADGAKPYTCIDSRYALEFKEKGDLTVWAKGMCTAGFIAEIHVRFTMDASVASLLLKRFGLPSTIIHLKADTSEGKTTTCKATLNLYGDAALLMKSMNGTANGFESYKMYMNGLVVVFDETTAKEQKDMTNITYRNDGQSKLRSIKTGGLAEMKKVTECVTIMTGEASHINSTSYGGEGVRMLEVPFKMKHIEADDFDLIEKTIRTTAGLAFPYIMEAIFEMDMEEELRKINKYFADTSNIHNRINKHAKVFCLAHIILDRAFSRISEVTGIQIPTTTFQEIVLPTFDEIKENASVVQDPMHIRMVKCLFGALQLEANNEGEKFFETIKDKDGNTRVATSGDRHITKFVVNPDKGELVIPCEAYKEMMQKYDKTLTPIIVQNALKEWGKKEIGFLRKKGEHLAQPRKVNDYTVPCYVLDMEKIKAAAGVDIRMNVFEPKKTSPIKAVQPVPTGLKFGLMQN